MYIISFFKLIIQDLTPNFLERRCEIKAMIKLTPKLGEFLVKATQIPDLEMALKQILREYLDLKLTDLNKEVKKFEKRWKMSFNEFLEKSKKGEIGKNLFSYETEKDFWNWERLETLRKYYKELRSQWM